MKKYFALILTVLTLVMLLVVGASAETFINPVANGADPFIFKDTDGTYYLYVTSGGSYGYRVYTSKNLVEWEGQGYCLRRGDVYTDPGINKLTDAEKGTTSAIYNFWAPEVIKEGDTYYMVYSAQEHIGIATSDSPLGPFTNDKTGYVIPYELTNRNADNNMLSTFRCIDGHFFKDDDGQLYLYFVSVGAFSMNGGSVTKGNNIWGGPFDLETLTFAEGYPKLLVQNESEYGQQSYPSKNSYPAWENQSALGILTPNKFDGSAVAEGPEMLKNGDTYYLTFSQDTYQAAQYSVFYVTADNPMGPFDSGDKTLAFITDDQGQKDTANPHLYGTAHHAFTTSPDGSELIMVYHCHRSGTDPNGTGGTVEERRICIDRAGFDENGFWAGSKTKGHPTAVAQDLPSGGVLTSKQAPSGTFEALATLPTVYISSTDGNDSAEGTRQAPLKSLTAAYGKLTNGGTIVLLQTYNAVNEAYNADNTVTKDYCELPAVNGPIMIKGDFSAVPFRFKFLSINSDTYFDNICFWPETGSGLSVIECDFNNVVMGEGVSCIAQPTLKTFPYLVGGKWWSTSSGTTNVYAKYNKYKNNAEVTSDKAYNLTVLSGTWTLVSGNSVKQATELANTAPGAVLTVGGEVKVRPAKALAPAVKASADGAVVTFNEVANASKYVIYRDGKVAGYSDTTTFVDSGFAFNGAASYTVAGYVNGACIGDVGTAASLDFVADVSGDGEINVADVMSLIKSKLNGESDRALVDVVIILKLATK